MQNDCNATVTHIDVKGYVYCTVHGVERKSWQRCRKLTPVEIRHLTSGGRIRYAKASGT